MKNYLKKTFRVACVAVLVALVGCHEDDPAPIRIENLTSDQGNWKLTGLKVTAAGHTEDVYDDEDFVEPCSKDDIHHFATPSVFQHAGGTTKCDAADPDVLEEGTWSYDAAEKELTITVDGVNETAKVKGLDSKKLILVVSETINGEIVTMTFIYTKQIQ